MKTKAIILAGALLATLNVLNAQEIEDPRTNIIFGAKAGLNISNVYDVKAQNFVADPKAGFAGGAFLGIPIGKYLGIQPEILFSQKGYQSSGTMLGEPYSDIRTTNFLDIPLQLQFKPFKMLTILGVIQYSYLLSQTDAYTFGSNSTAQEQQFKNDNVRRNIMGAVLGVDLNIKRFIFSAKYFLDLQNNAGDGTSSTPRYKNCWFQATVGFRIIQ